MKKKKILYCFIISILFLLVFTKSSPLYKINDWYDAQCFFTVGKSMMIGKVPYIDLFDQKGPLLFLIYGIASLISQNTFIGVFILEIIFYTIFLYYIDKVINIFIDGKYSYHLLPILSALILSSRSFTAGGSCEEFAFPLIAMTMYHLVRYLKTNDLKNHEALLIGIITGCILWMKYTLLGLSIGFCLIVFIKKVNEKNYKDLFRKILCFLLGIAIVSIPWIIYFGLHNNGLKKLIDVYFLFNINSYAEKTNILQKILRCLITMLGVVLKYFQYLILIFIPLAFSIKNNIFFKEKINNIYLTLAIALQLAIIFIGGVNFRYYSLPIQPFMILGLISIVKLLEKRDIKISLMNSHIIIAITICLVAGILKSPNTEFILKDKSYYAQYEFSKKIEKNQTLLNYGFLDGGFYFTTKTSPNTYYFQKNNVKYKVNPQNADEQNRYIEEKLTDYVVAKKLNKHQKKILEENYVLVDTHKQKYEGKKVKYSLYKRKTDS